MADFDIATIRDDAVNGTVTTVGTTGIVERSIAMLGVAGATATGNGEWVRTNSYWKTFFLYSADRKTAITTEVVVIDACMELAGAPDDPDLDTAYVELVTLNAGTPSFSTEVPWRYLRARVTTAIANAVRVGLNAQGA